MLPSLNVTRKFPGAPTNALRKLSLGRHVPPPRYNRVQRDRDRREYQKDRRRINADRSRPVFRLPREICFPPNHLLGVRGVVADGDAKAHTKCRRGVTAPKRAGARRKGRAGEKRGAKRYWDGWFFSLRLKKGRIPQTAPTYRPENNDFALDELEKVVERYPHVNCFIYDRTCKIQKSVLQRKKKLWKIRTYATDKFHGARHKQNCAANPFTRPRLMGESKT